MSEKINDGGPAFPCPTGDPCQEPDHGLSLRDYFAAQALAGAADIDCSRLSLGEVQQNARALASIAYAIADAMLQERSK